MYPLHQNDTGSFQELVHTLDIGFIGQISLLTIKPRCKRGGHYHTYKKEWFCCLHGKGYLIIANTDGVQMSNLLLDSCRKEFIPVKPYEVHTILNAGDQECELLVISSEEYDPDNPDTIKYEAKKELAEVK